jgi:starch synthase
MRILLASSEVAPFAKTGGLADVAAALPKALCTLGHDVRVVLPKYRAVDAARHGLRPRLPALPVPIAWTVEQAAVWEAPGGPLPVYFIQQDDYYDREGLYQVDGRDHPDNHERFAFFSRAVLEMSLALDFVPDVYHCNDWQTGLIPAYLREVLHRVPALGAAGVLFTVHNLGYQGLFRPAALAAANLPAELFTPAGLEFFGKVNFLKAGLVWSDLVSTVSRRYSQEIQTEEFGHGLEGVLRARKADLHGILNGIDYEEWHPARDRFLAAPYSLERPDGKAACKRDLQQSLGLPVRPDVPLLAVISRLATQKGIDLVAAALDRLFALDTQLVLLGTGEPVLHEAFEAARAKHGSRLGLRLGFDVALSHKIEAGADIFLMPSRYEPCGLNQMYSLAYGTVPVVRATGGLDDTIEPFDAATRRGTGFKFSDASAEALVQAVRDALAVYRQPDRWRALVRNGMQADFSWQRSAHAYEELYREIARRRGGAADRP